MIHCIKIEVVEMDLGNRNNSQFHRGGGWIIQWNLSIVDTDFGELTQRLN